MKRAIKNNNVGQIERGTKTPPKIMSCGIVQSRNGNIVGHVHESFKDLDCFESKDGLCLMCEAGVVEWPVQYFHVVNDVIRLIRPDDPQQYNVQLHGDLYEPPS